MAGPRCDELLIIDAADPAVRWRFECPNGHRAGSIKPARTDYRCRTCDRDDGIDDPRHETIVDKRRGEEIHWGDIDYRHERRE